MIRVTIELISAQDRQKTTLGIMDIFNTGESRDPRIGQYRGRLYRKGSRTKVQREGAVQNWPRQSYTVWRLVLRMLKDMHPEECDRFHRLQQSIASFPPRREATPGDPSA